MKLMHGSRNRLVRRLGMHANMTGLFRFSEAASNESARAGKPGLAASTQATGLPLAKAFMPLPEPAGEGALAPSAAPYISSELPLAGSRPEPARVEASAPVPSGIVFRAPETDPVSAPAAEEKSQPPEGDPIWNRLQNIFNKHTSKNRPRQTGSLPQPYEGQAAPPDTSAVAGTGPASAPLEPESPVGNEAGRPSIQRQHEAASSPPAQHTGAPSPGIKGEVNYPQAKQERAGNEAGLNSVQTKREAASSPPMQHAEAASPEMKDGTYSPRAEQEPESVEASSPTAPADVIQAAFEGSPSANLPFSTPAEEAAATKLHPDIARHATPESAQDEQSLSQPMIEAPDAQTHNLQSLPLEAVWAVETVRQPQSRSTFPPVPNESDKPVFTREEIDRPGESASADQTAVQRAAWRDEIVRNTLQDVHTAQATGSGIELIPPRRPRPVPAPAGSSETVIESSRPPAEAAQSAMQRQVDTSPGNEIVEPGVVPTEIGPLPGDLWNLVGAPTPPVTNAAPQGRPALNEISRWEEQSPVTGADPAASPLGQSGQAQVVQRQVASPATAEPGSAAPPAGEAASEKQTGDDMDIEELARQVYNELKHRLGLEWERLHRR